MYPNNETFPDLPYNAINTKHLLYDLVYNPEESQFLKKGMAKGAQIKNGKQMLYLQAEKSWKIWNLSINL
jgi:shikimate dehydrogenase